MQKKSNKLLDIALRELKTAIEENKKEVEITLVEKFSGNKEKAEKISKKYEMKSITEILRRKFKGYEIKSEIYKKLNLLAITSFKNKPCATVVSYLLVWKLSFWKKQV